MEQLLADDIECWRLELATHLRTQWPEMEVRERDRQARRRIDKLIFHRICEARGLDGSVTGPQPEIGDSLLLADMLATVQSRLGPGGPYDFSQVSDDLLGRLHERLIGSELKETPDGFAIEMTSARKAGGAFYTPGHIVRLIVDDTVGALLVDRSPADRPLRVLDPAAGGGFFLLGAYRRLLDWHGDHADRSVVLRESIHGVDLDPQAIAVTHAALALCALAGPVPTTSPDVFEPQLVVGNSLLGPDYQGPTNPEALPLDWQRAFPDVFAEGGFDVIIANPPYLNLKRGFLTDAEKAYFATTYRSAAGQYDAFVLFLERSLQLLRVGGRLGFIVPKPVLVSENYEAIRGRLLADSRIESITDCGSPFPGAGVEAVTIIATRDESKPDHVVTMRRIGPAATPVLTQLGSVCQGALERTPFAGLSYLVDDARLGVIRRICEGGVQLGDLCETFMRGIEHGKSSLTRSPAGKRTLRGEDVRPFVVTDDNWFYDATPERCAKWKSADLYEGEKVLVRRVADRPMAAVDRDGRWVLNTLYVLRPVCGVSSAWLVACINSCLLAWVFRLWFLSDDRLFPYLRKSQLVQLPVPDPRTLPAADVTAIEQLVVAAEAVVAVGTEPTDERAAMDDRLATLFQLSPTDRDLVGMTCAAERECGLDDVSSCP